MPRQSHARIQIALTGRGAKLAASAEAHEKNVLAITRRIHTLDGKIKALSKQLADAKAERKHKRRELRAVLQRDATMGIDDEDRLTTAGKADAVDGAVAHAERRR